MAVQSTLGLHGTSRSPWASFAGKASSGPKAAGLVSVLGLYGSSRIPWASFAGKAAPGVAWPDVWDGGAWRTATSVKVWDGGAWRTATSVKVYDGAAWREQI